MLRSMFQVYVRGSDKAAELYKNAFDAELVDEYKNEDGTYMHAELDVFGQILSLSELPPEKEQTTGTTMQLCLHMGEGGEELVIKAHEALKEGAEITFPLGECMFSPLMFGLIDRFGVNWCVFV